jgi:Cdc6-like AAA superfamily ATPase
MKKEVKIIVPTDWSAVTLKKYLELRKDMSNYEDDKDAIIACMFHHLCDFPVEYINGLRYDTYNQIITDLVSFLNKIEYPLQKLINIDGIEYESLTDASKQTGIKGTTIWHRIKSKNEKYG